MKAVILAAGEGRRMRPLTLNTPKPLLAIAGQPILARIAESLPEAVDEIILVIGYLGEQIQNLCGRSFHGRPVRYVWQREKLGTAHALRLTEPHVGRERFLLLYADDLHGPDGLRACLAHERALLVAEHPEPQHFGVVSVNADGSVAGITEKPERPASHLVSTGAMVLDANIFNYEPTRHASGEYYLTSMLGRMLRHHPVTAVRTDAWFPIATPEDLAAAEQLLADRAAAR